MHSFGTDYCVSRILWFIGLPQVLDCYTKNHPLLTPLIHRKIRDDIILAAAGLPSASSTDLLETKSHVVLENAISLLLWLFVLYCFLRGFAFLSLVNFAQIVSLQLELFELHFCPPQVFL